MESFEFAFDDRFRLLLRGIGVSEHTALVTVSGLEGGAGWQPRARFIDLPGFALGAAGVGPTVLGEASPPAWDIARARGRYVLAWQGASGTALRTFCFAPPAP